MRTKSSNRIRVINKNKKSSVALALLFLLLLTSCQQTSYDEYKSLVKVELASNHRVDSLFLGISLGMPGRDFYRLCWDMNRQGILTDGENNTAVLYKLKDQLKYPASMNFYPDFKDNRISSMGVSFKYDAWAPWNKHLDSDHLREDVVQLMESWYPGSNPFIRMEDEERGIIHVKVDGNRRIIVGAYNEAYVKVVFTDLSVENELTVN